MITSTMAFATTLGQKGRACFDRAVQVVIGLLVWPLEVAR